VKQYLGDCIVKFAGVNLGKAHGVEIEVTPEIDAIITRIIHYIARQRDDITIQYEVMGNIAEITVCYYPKIIPNLVLELHVKPMKDENVMILAKRLVKFIGQYERRKTKEIKRSFPKQEA
jgi:CTP synthase (UTP-ammonia lyase)